MRGRREVRGRREGGGRELGVVANIREWTSEFGFHREHVVSHQMSNEHMTYLYCLAIIHKKPCITLFIQ